MTGALTRLHLSDPASLLFNSNAPAPSSCSRFLSCSAVYHRLSGSGNGLSSSVAVCARQDRWPTTCTTHRFQTLNCWTSSMKHGTGTSCQTTTFRCHPACKGLLTSQMNCSKNLSPL